MNWAAAWQNLQIDLCAQWRLRPVWSESLQSAWRNLGSLATHLAQSEDSELTARVRRLVWVFAGRTYHFVDFVVLRLNFLSVFTFKHVLQCVQHLTTFSEVCLNCTQGMQSRDSCVQREISSSITLLHTGTIKVQVRIYFSSDFISCLRIFSANTLQPVQKSLFNWPATRLECSWQAVAGISHVWHWKSLSPCCLLKLLFSKPYKAYYDQSQGTTIITLNDNFMI